MLWKTLRILCLSLTLFVSACGDQSEVTVSLPQTTTTLSYPEIIPPAKPATTTTTSTTLAPTTTTTTLAASTYQAASYSDEGVWDDIAQCESGGNWALDDYHDGGLQFHPDTWTSYVAAGKPYEMVGYPPYAHQATREQQILVAIRVRDGVKGSSSPYLNPQGWNAWPNCRHAAGV